MNFKKILGSVAPFLGTLIGGPFGATAGALVGKLLLGDDTASEEDMKKALGRATPEQLVQLQQIDADHKIKMAQVGLNKEKIAQLDRDSARKREIAVKDKTPARLAYLLTFGFFGVLATIIFVPIQPEVVQIVDVLLGALGGAWVSVVSYFFGSSNGSQIKTELLTHTQ